AADRRLVLLPGARLGRPDQPDHGAVRVPHRGVEPARDRRAALEAVARHAVRDLVHGRRLLLAVLALQESGRARDDARREFPGFAGPLLDVRAGLVLPWKPARAGAGRAKGDGAMRAVLLGLLLAGGTALAQPLPVLQFEPPKNFTGSLGKDPSAHVSF